MSIPRRTANRYRQNWKSVLVVHIFVLFLERQRVGNVFVVARCPPVSFVNTQKKNQNVSRRQMVAVYLR